MKNFILLTFFFFSSIGCIQLDSKTLSQFQNEGFAQTVDCFKEIDIHDVIKMQATGSSRGPYDDELDGLDDDDDGSGSGGGGGGGGITLLLIIAIIIWFSSGSKSED